YGNPNAKDKIGSGAQTAQFLVGEGVGVVIANNMSLEALSTLKELKVKVYSGVSGKAEKGGKIAVAANGPSLNSQVAPRFGTASYFLIIDPQKPALLKSIPNPVIQDDYRG
ncbi:unnamed protein product, partial [marine sediment metagenome]